MPNDTKSVELPSSVPRSNQRRRTVWQEAAKRALQGEMALRGYGYKRLARELGGDWSEQALMTRVNRGNFSVAFFFQLLRTMGTKSIGLDHLPDLSKAPPRAQTLSRPK